MQRGSAILIDGIHVSAMLQDVPHYLLVPPGCRLVQWRLLAAATPLIHINTENPHLQFEQSQRSLGGSAQDRALPFPP